MDTKTFLACLSILLSFAVCEESLNSMVNVSTSTLNNKKFNSGRYVDIETYRRRLDNQTDAFEKSLKKFIKGAVKSFLPNLMKHNSDNSISTKCTSSLLKYISGLTSVKVWAMRMLDATSKPPAGIFEGTFSDFGGFDQCLDVFLPKRNGEIEFRGKYCAIEASPRMPPLPKNFSMAKQQYADPLDNIREEMRIAGAAFFYLKFRLGVCVPSLCTLQDMQVISDKVSSIVEMDVAIPQCYVKEELQFKPIHIAVICVVSLLFLACLVGSFIDCQSENTPQAAKLGTLRRIFKCFSIPSNVVRLVSSSKGSEELKFLHGLRALSMAWVLLGHTYVWTNFQLLRGASIVPKWFNSFAFELIMNTWIAVEIFFFLSGMLTSFAVLKIMAKTNGKISVPMYILRRYIRLFPPLLLTMGLVFFLPLISSGPFWYERVDPELAACTHYWWTSILMISNWTPLRNICVHPTWYLSADFQLYVVSIVFIYFLYRCPKLGLSLICAVVIMCSVVVGVYTYQWELPPIIQISSGNNEKIQDTIDIVHTKTFTHAGPYYIGIIVGFLMIKYKDLKLTRVISACGWCASTVLVLCSIYGGHRWNIGEPHGPLLTSLFAGLHRTTYTMGVAWVTFVCVTGNGGFINKFLSLSVFAPFGRLTFSMYLLHSLVIWTKVASQRERFVMSHYNLLYDWVGHILVTLLLTVPFYLILEAPMSNLERLLLTGVKQPAKDEALSNQKSNDYLTNNANPFSKDSEAKNLDIVSSVQLTGVKNLGFLQDASLPDVTRAEP